MIPQLAVTDSAFAVATTYQYDEQGRTTQVANAQGIINYAYNDLGQQICTWTSTDGTGTDAVTDTRYSYDSLGRLSTVAVYERFNAYAPGAGSEPNTAEELTTYHYDAVGNLDYLVTDAISGTAITTDYVYDSLNRLDALTHFVDADGDGSYDALTEQAMAQFDYTLDAAGNRVGAAETVDGHEYQWSWSYDALNRLTGETLETPTPGDEALAYADTFTYDLAGNRVLTSRDREGAVESTTTYAYDANDRLLTEVTDHASDNSQDRYTQYSYAHTTQTGRTVYEGLSDQGVLQSTTAYQYDAMGRMVETTETAYTNGVDPQTKTTQYAYNAQGLRVTETITDAGGTVTTKSYLFDPTGGHTGYAQVLEEYLNGQLAYAYTLGHDVIAVAKAAGITDALGNTAATVHHLLTDGHGSTRLLANLASALAGQGNREADLGQAKVNATAQLCRELNSQLSIETHQERFRRSTPDLGNVLFCCVDSITTRAHLWQAVRERVAFFTDGRMHAEVIRIVTAADAASRVHYSSTLFAAEHAHRGACTARSTIYTANIAAGLMLSQFTRWLRGLPVEGDLQVNLLSAEMVGG